MAKCEYQCPYLTDPAIKGRCPFPSGLDQAAAIQSCAEKVSHQIMKGSFLGDNRFNLHTDLLSGTGANRTARKLGVPDESDLEL